MRGRTGHEPVEELVIEPWLEPDLSPAARSTLTQANVRLLHFYRFHFEATVERFLILGLGVQFRDVARQRTGG